MTISPPRRLDFGLKLFKLARKLRLTVAMKSRLWHLLSNMKPEEKKVWRKMFIMRCICSATVYHAYKIQIQPDKRIDEKYTIQTVKPRSGRIIRGVMAKSGTAGLEFLSLMDFA